MDRITKKLVEEFNLSIELNRDEEFKQFENFCNYSIIANVYTKSFEINSVDTGEGNDTGIDGLAIIVNDQLIENSNEMTEIIETGVRLRVEYIFISSKTSDGFKTTEIGQFTHGILDFFSENPLIVRNDEIENFAEISNLLLDNSSLMSEAPTCKVYYITTGRIIEDKNLDGRIESSRQDLLNTNIFVNVEFERFGAFEICNKYRKTKDAVTTTINFVTQVTLPCIDGIKEAYIGILPLSEFKKIIKDDNGNIRNVFDDNLRDFQGVNNPVNKKIESTLSGTKPDLFSVLNNGVTIVASSLVLVSNRFTIKDYQVVNGCQTSNILSIYIDKPDLKDLSIPLKLIVTENEDIKNQITIATNSQTVIKQDQLSALSNFLKNLEHYFNTLDLGEGKLYFERRAKQYAADAKVQKSRITTIQIQIKSFASMFLLEPHRVTTYYGSMVKQMQNQEKPIFVDGHLFDSYYMSSFAYYRMMILFTKGLLDKKYKKVKFFLLMIVNYIAGEGKNITPSLNRKKEVLGYCNPIIKILLDESKSEILFNKAANIIDSSGLEIDDKQAIKNKSATDVLLKELKK